MSKTSGQTSIESRGWPSLEAAYESVRHEIDAVPDKHLVAINVDVEKAITHVLQCMPTLQVYRAPALDIAARAEMETCTEALAAAHVRHRLAS